MCSLLTRGLPFLVIAALLSPSPAKAGGVVITWGDTIKHLGEVSNQHKPEVQREFGADVAVGYKYRYWGLFWIDLWTRDGEYCLYRGECYWPLPPAEAAELVNKAEGELGKPFLYRFPLGWILLAACSLIIGVRMFFAKPLKDKISAVARDWRYCKALAVMSEHARRMPVADAGSEVDNQTGTSSFEVAVLYLSSHGIPQAEAEHNLAQLLAVLPADVHRLLEDERYCQAMQIWSEHAKKERIAPAEITTDKATGPSALEAAALHLISQGLSRAEAEHNLALILLFLPAYAPPNQTTAVPDRVLWTENVQEGNIHDFLA